MNPSHKIDQISRIGRWQWKKVIQYFFQGVIILAPIMITIWAVVSLFSFVDGLLPTLLEKIAPGFLERKGNNLVPKIPGLGFILVLFLVVVVGYFSSFFVIGRLVRLFDHLLERTPGIKFIYSSVKDFFEAFAGDKKKFNRPVLVCLHQNDVWEIGFITNDEGDKFQLPQHKAVYIPFSYSIAGKVFWVPATSIRTLDQVNAGDAMKFVISGGVTEVEEGNSPESPSTNESTT